MHHDVEFSQDVIAAIDSLVELLEKTSNLTIKNLGNSFLESFLMLLKKYEDCCICNDNQKLAALRKDFFELKSVLKPFNSIVNRV